VAVRYFYSFDLRFQLQFNAVVLLHTHTKKELTTVFDIDNKKKCFLSTKSAFLEDHVTL